LTATAAPPNTTTTAPRISAIGGRDFSGAGCAGVCATGATLTLEAAATGVRTVGVTADSFRTGVAAGLGATGIVPGSIVSIKLDGVGRLSGRPARPRSIAC